jgi:hypothetical protein
MKMKYPNDWQEILHGNAIADKLASSNPLPILPYPLTHSNLPPYIISDPINFSTCTSKIINQHFKLKTLALWKKHAPTRSEWFFNQDIDHSAMKALPSRISDHFQRITQSILPTRERLSKFFAKPNNKIHPNKLTQLKLTYNSIYCHLCVSSNSQAIDNHQHILSDCSIAQILEERFNSSLTNLIRQFSPITGGILPGPTLLPVSSSQTVPQKWIIRGQIPTAFRTSISNLKSNFTPNSLVQAVSLLIGTVSRAKWILKCHSIYHPQDSPTQLVSKPQFQYLSIENLTRQSLSLLKNLPTQ